MEIPVLALIILIGVVVLALLWEAYAVWQANRSYRRTKGRGASGSEAPHSAWYDSSSSYGDSGGGDCGGGDGDSGAGDCGGGGDGGGGCDGGGGD